MDGETEIVGLLREIRDRVGHSVAVLEAHSSSALAQQRQQLERQAEIMAMQREHLAMARQQFDRAERIQERAEALQGRAGKAMRVVLWIALPLLIVLMLLVLAPLLLRHW